MRPIDVSMPLFAGMPAFPGDPAFSYERTHDLARGDAYNVSRLVLGSHAGTHVDPPIHFVRDGATIDQIDLRVLRGPAVVAHVEDSVREIGVDEVDRLPPRTRRVLFRTANSARWDRGLTFFDDYVALSPTAADALIQRRVRLVGIDSLSVERDPTGKFPVHHRLLGAGVLILEGLLLGAVPPGACRVECLPLRLRGGDGGPARVLVTPRGRTPDQSRSSGGSMSGMPSSIG